MPVPDRYSIADYFVETPVARVFRAIARAKFSPLDVNVAFLLEAGWNQAVDRLRFHTTLGSDAKSTHPLMAAIQRSAPSLLLRRLDREEDTFVSVTIDAGGEVTVLSNDASYARKSLEGIFIGCPPSFHEADEFEMTEAWVDDDHTLSHFLGMLSGAMGWDPSHNVPANIRHSLEEAHKSLAIANYRSTVVMSRRTLEGVMKFGFGRLLKRPPVNKKGQPLMLNDMIQQFRSEPSKPIPEHLLHIADSVRLIGNVPGAHSADLKNYQFSRSDAEYALYAVSHFLNQYFSKIDQEVWQYYTVEIDLTSANDATSEPTTD